MPRNRPRPQHPQTCRGTPASQASPVVRAAVPHRTTTEGRTIAKSVHLKHTIRTERSPKSSWPTTGKQRATSCKALIPTGQPHMTVVQVVQCSRCMTKRNIACAPLAKALGPVQGCIHVEEWRLFLTYTKALYELASH